MSSFTKIRGIALEGGGIAGIAHVGVVKVLDDIGVYPRLTHFVGSSAGSMMAGLMACRIKSIDIQEILINLDFRKLEDDSWFVFRDLYRLWNEFGWNRGQAIEDIYGDILEKYIGDRNITYQQVKDRFGSTLITTSTDVGLETTIYRGPETSPNLPIAKGIRESASIPIFYCPVHDGESMMVDGGTLNNYPIRKLYEYLPKEQVLGSKLISSQDRTVGRSTADIPHNLRSYIQKILKMLHDQNLRVHVKEEDWKRTVTIDVGEVSATDFDLSEEGKLDLIREGEGSARKFFNL